jgi:hypothetical protein
MSENIVDIMKELQGLTLLVRFVTEPDRLRAAVSIPNSKGGSTLDSLAVALEVHHQGAPLRMLQAPQPRMVKTQLRGVTSHLLYELEPPPGVSLGEETESFGCVLSFRGEGSSFDVRL